MINTEDDTEETLREMQRQNGELLVMTKRGEIERLQSENERLRKHLDNEPRPQENINQRASPYCENDTRPKVEDNWSS